MLSIETMDCVLPCFFDSAHLSLLLRSAVALLARMLTFLPEDRASVDEALRSPCQFSDSIPCGSLFLTHSRVAGKHNAVAPSRPLRPLESALCLCQLKLAWPVSNILRSFNWLTVRFYVCAL